MGIVPTKSVGTVPIGIVPDIYNLDRKLHSTVNSMESSGISGKNKQLIQRFIDNCFSEGLSKIRIIRYITTLKYLAMFIGKDFDTVTKEDIKSVVAQIEMKNYAEWSKHFYKVTLKKFYAWLNGCERGIYPECVRWMQTSVKKNRLRTPEVLTKEEIERMIDVCKNTRDKAFISVLYESGCRIGEIMNLRKCDAQFDEHGAVLMVNGKTGFRRVRVLNNTAMLLSRWMYTIPDNSHVWVNKNGKLLSYWYVKKVLKRLAVKVGITKRIYPHLFRHSRATFLSQFLSDAQMKVFFGWTQGSDMASVYVHLSGKDIDKTLIELSQKG